MNITSASMKMWSVIGPRATFGMAALELAKSTDELIVLTGDTSTSAGLDRFRRAFPDKLIDVGIAEQNMMGIAAGLASEGFRVVTTTFAPFQTMRCCEQIKVNLGYMRQKVCFVGLASGVVLGTLGYTHCCIEDVGIIRSIPGITVVSPADCTETVKATLAAVHHEESVYLRLTGGARNPQVYKEDYDFEIGKAITLKEGDDVTIFASGTMVHESLQASEILAEENIFSAVVNMHTLKPIDVSAVRKACETSRLIVTIEEHSVIGGLGSAVAECKAELTNAPPQLILGLPDEYGMSGEYKFIMEKNGLSPMQLANTIKQYYENLG